LENKAISKEKSKNLKNNSSLPLLQNNSKKNSEKSNNNEKNIKKNICELEF
jgi:hypothetical protein